MAEKISGVYKITNTITGDFYIGSSKDVKRRCAEHKKQSTWKRCSNNPLYQDMQKYGVGKFELQILAEVESDFLKETEQKFIEKMHPTYNNNRANGWNKECHRKAVNKYRNKLCCFNGETLTINALAQRFRKVGVENPIKEAKKYLAL